MKRGEAPKSVPFRMGSFVQLSELGRQRCPSLVGHGVVVGFARTGRTVKVQFADRKTPTLLHVTYLEAVEGVCGYVIPASDTHRQP
jgi:hypothetical protein